MTARTLFLDSDHARERMANAWRYACDMLSQGKSVRVRIDEKKSTRSLEQNDKMWAVLTDISRQVQWPVDGKMQFIEPEDWKHVLSAGLKRHQRVAQGVDGGFVILGQRTSQMSIGEMCELIELAQAFGAEHGVSWSEGRRA
ncbi:recombination protein NinB [Dyella japonica]|uniref:NinB protein n=1 Tax=Dyella japonica TaxID=231455 RepID=A0ABV2JZ28_9GAMM